MFTLCCQSVSRIVLLVKKALRLMLRWISLRLRPRLEPGKVPRSSSDPLLDYAGEYEDLLKHLRMVGDLRWTFATHGPSQNPANISPKAIKEGVLKSDRIADVISRQVAESGVKDAKIPVRTEAHLMAQVRTILEEMGHSYNIWYIRLLGFILIKAVKRMYEHIWVNAEVLRELEPLFTNRDIPVILMPTHRSYADFLIVSFVSFHYGLPLPSIASGIDFLGMRVVGEVLRRAGAFFIRRSFADDPLYRTVFAEYVQSILSQPQPMEFFVEGTRSRSGKSLYPKFGLLQASVEVFLRGSVSDILVIPITITYERTLEENLYARELLGVPKPRESTSALIKATGVLQDNYGSTWFHFGKPISVRDFVEGKVDRSGHNLVPRNQMSMRPDELAVVKSLAFAVILEQQKHIRIHNWTILSTVLLHRLRLGSTRFPVEEILADCNVLDSLIMRSGIQQDDGRKFSIQSIHHCVKIHGNVARLNLDESVVEFQPTAVRDLKVVHMLLAHYRNQLLHRVIPQVLHIVSSRVSLTPGQNANAFLSRMFAREFVVPPDEMGDIVLLDSQTEGDSVLLETLIEPFLVGYAVVLRILLVDGFPSHAHLKTARTLSKALQVTIEKVLDAGAYPAYEILSLDMLLNCIQAVKGMGALIQVETDQPLQLNREILVDISFQLEFFVQPAVLLSVTNAIESVFCETVRVNGNYGMI